MKTIKNRNLTISLNIDFISIHITYLRARISYEKLGEIYLAKSFGS